MPDFYIMHSDFIAICIEMVFNYIRMEQWKLMVYSKIWIYDCIDCLEYCLCYGRTVHHNTYQIEIHLIYSYNLYFILVPSGIPLPHFSCLRWTMEIWSKLCLPDYSSFTPWFCDKQVPRCCVRIDRVFITLLSFQKTSNVKHCSCTFKDG